MGEGEDVGFDPAKLILGEGIKLVGGVVPPLIKKMTDKLPGPLEPAKQPLNTCLTTMFNKIVKVLGQGPSKWNDEGKKECTEIVIGEGMKLAAELKSKLP